MLSLPGYTFFRQLGTGARTLVYSGRRDRDGVHVVAKLCRSAVPTARELALLRHEFAILRELDMPELGRAYAIEPYEMGLAMIREHIEGRSLEALLAAAPNQRLPVISAITIAINVASTLDKIHRERVIHKDIKPSNVLVDPRTLETWLIDFGISARLSSAAQTMVAPSSLEGTLAYMSPEQTGRMNRVVDHRSDLYMLGATLYEMVTGSRPFTTNNTLELIHSHIARRPSPPHELLRSTPRSLSDIIMKLLAKAAEDRYQSGFGLERDLRRCLARLESGDRSPFPLARDDVSTQLRVPQKLYGRERAVKQLRAAFERAALGGAEFLTITGQPGAGKSSLVQEVHKTIASRGGYFISGKYDRMQRSVPYAPILAALENLIRQFLGESDEMLEQWKQQILAALGSSGGVLTDVLPSLELIIGPQPEPPALDPSAAQNRFNLVFQNFLGSLTTPIHPLVLFLDDLQWADQGSLTLLGNLLKGESSSCLLVLGAYRPGEIDAAHPLRGFFADLADGGVTYQEVQLRTLDQPAVASLLADTLLQPHARVEELAALVLDKTDGNPLFIRTFLQRVYEDGLLKFDAARGSWTWKLASIRRLESTDNVVELMASKIARLPAAGQRALQLGACFGHTFELRQLARVIGESARAVATTLWTALEAGLLLPLGTDYRFFHPGAGGSERDGDIDAQLTVRYKFLHDRVREAAEAQLSEADKLDAHLRIGRLLRQELTAENVALFDVVGHLNRAAALISDARERVELARLNHEAGQKARDAAAYAAASRYFEAGRALLEAERWDFEHELRFNLYVDGAESYGLCGRLDEAKALLSACHEHTRTNQQHTRRCTVAITIFLTLSEVGAAIEAATATLARFGIELPASEDERLAAANRAEVALHRLCDGGALSKLLHRPASDNSDVHGALKILVATSTAAYVTSPHLYTLINLTGVILTLEHGPSDLAAFPFANYGVVLSGMRARYRESQQYGRLALELLEKFPNAALRSKVNVVVSAYEHFGAPLSRAIPRYRLASTQGMEAGDFTYASYAQFYTLVTRIAAGHHLNVIEDDLVVCEALIKKTKNRFVDAYARCVRQVLNNYRVGTSGPAELSGPEFDEDEYFAELTRNRYAPITFRYCCFKQQLLYLAERYGDALAATQTAESYANSAMGSLDLTELHFYKCLILLALASEEQPEFRASKPWRESQRQIETWATACPENFRHKSLLIAAEEARISGDEFAALNLYDRAIETPLTNEFQHHAALANKLSARFHLARRRSAAARGYLAQAHRAYLKWGAANKASELAASYTHVAAFEIHDPAPAPKIARGRGMIQLPAASSSHTSMRLEDVWDSGQVSDVTTTSSTASTTGTTDTALDLEAVLKASRALSGEMVLSRLLRRLMELLIESAGAERGYLILPKGGELCIEASGAVDASHDQRDISVTDSIPVSGSRLVPRAIINYVARTNENIVLSDASNTGHFAADPYIAEAQPRSVLCTPLVHQGKQIGLLYLENNLTAGAFTLDRLRVLYILSAQAAISIENARLYATITKSERKFRSLFEDSNDAIFLTTKGGELLDVNRATLELFGYTAEEVAALPGERLYVDKDGSRDFRDAIETLGAIRDYEVQLRKKDGTPIDCLLSAATVRIGDDVAYQGIIRDVTERKRAARLLADYNRTLERTVEERTQEVRAKNVELSATLDKLKATQDQLILNEKMASLGTLSAGIAHELKNPLNFINNFALLSLRTTKEMREELEDAREEVGEEFAEVQDELLVDLDENLETIQKHGKRADAIIQSMLFHARSQGGPAHATNINELLSSELNLAYHGIRVKNDGFNMSIKTDYDPNLSQLEVVPQDLSRVFLNIINNGMYAAWEKKRRAPEREFDPALKITTRELQDAVEIRIHDNGIGISEDIRAKIFTPFFTSKPPGEGTGLGLAMSHEIVVQKYNGDIEVNSLEGQFAEFVITLPKPAAGEKIGRPL